MNVVKQSQMYYCTYEWYCAVIKQFLIALIGGHSRLSLDV